VGVATLTLAPATESELADAIRAAHSARTLLAIEGGGTRTGLGRPAQTQDTLSLAKLSGVTLYEPAELVLSAHAGTPLAEIEAILAARNHMLPFEPVDHRRLYGSSGAPTIGAIAACNLSGPRRISHGAARDSLIGLRIVNGTGETVKSGGRVMKNVTGLDLVKLSCGAYGTLGVLSEVTFKLLPKPEAEATLVLRGLDDRAAIDILSRALGSPFEVSGAAHLPAGIGAKEARTLVRVENFAPSVDYRVTALREALGGGERVEADASRALWRDIAEVAFFAAPDASAVWRISTAPTRGPEFVEQVRRIVDARCFYDWGGGLVWLAVPDTGDASAAAIRAAIAGAGHATLMRASDETRARVDVFQPLAAPVMTLTRGIKAAFDPGGILNPGRMYAGV
jgi:glycolate oxidase FAD binding subunit